MIGEPDAGKPHVRFDEGVQETCDTVTRLRPTLRPDRSPSRNPAKPFSSKPRTQYSTDRGASPSSFATSGHVMPCATNNTPWSR